MRRGLAHTAQYHLRQRVVQRRTLSQRLSTSSLDHPLTQVVLTCLDHPLTRVVLTCLDHPLTQVVLTCLDHLLTQAVLTCVAR